MEVILLETIANLGDIGDTVAVKPGYARNYLLPAKKALRATPEALVMVERQRQKLLEEAKERLDVAKARADAAVKELTFERTVIDAEGRLFGSVTASDVVTAAAVAGTELLRSEIVLREGTIKEIGDYTAVVTLNPEVVYDMSIHVIADNPEVMESQDDANAESAEPEQEPEQEQEQVQADDGAEAPPEEQEEPGGSEPEGEEDEEQAGE